MDVCAGRVNRSFQVIDPYRMKIGSELLRFECLFMVLFDKRLDIGNLVVNFLTDLREGNEAFVPPGLSGAWGDFHHSDEIGVVEVLLRKCLLWVVELLLDVFEVVDQVLVLRLGKDYSIHGF